jgi:hypothetical protein
VLGSFCAAGGFQVPLMIDGDFASGQYIRIISTNLPVPSSPIARRLLAGKECESLRPNTFELGATEPRAARPGKAPRRSDAK